MQPPICAPEPPVQEGTPQQQWWGRGIILLQLAVPAFRTDDWPLPEGVSYAKEPERASKEALDRLRHR